MSLIVNALTSANAANFVQNSTAQVLSEGCLKAVGRPLFTMVDKTASKEERKYSATKEFLYQSMSMAAYFALIFPIRKNSFRLLKYFPQLKDCEVAKASNLEQFKKSFNNISDELTKTKIKGAQELISIIASGAILAIAAPQLVNRVVHPVMERLDKKKLDKNA